MPVMVAAFSSNHVYRQSSSAAAAAASVVTTTSSAALSSSSSLLFLSSSSSSASSDATSTTTETVRLTVSLEKPLGLILEEVEKNEPMGVFVLELGDDGSAAEAAEKDLLLGARLTQVMGDDVTTISFEQVMEKIMNAPALVEMEFLTTRRRQTKEVEDTGLAVGTSVAVVVQRDGQPDLTINANVGDNLRKTLLDNNVEVYRGFKAKIGNCGGAGQCGFCAVEFIDSEGWAPRTDYETKKIKNTSPNSRLSCMNNIQGPVTVKM